MSAGPPFFSPRVWSGLGVVAIAACAFALRCIGWEWVFVGDGEVVFKLGDTASHLRRALFAFENFPSVLAWDGFINFPKGSVPHPPPLYPLLLAASALPFAHETGSFERFVAWWSPLASAATIPFVALAARQVASRRTALGAAALFATMPIAVTASRVGDVDQHAFDMMLGAAFLAVCLRAASPRLGGREVWLLGFAWAVLRTLLPPTWSGSLLYTLIADPLLIGVAVATQRRDLLAAVAIALAVAGASLLAFAGALPEPIGGRFSAIAFSLLHGWLALAAAATAALALAAETRWPGATVSGRLWRLAALGAAVLAALLLVPGLASGLVLGFDLVAGGPGDVANYELLPLFDLAGRGRGQAPELYFGWFAYAVPFAPLAALWAARDTAQRPAAVAFGAWTTPLAAATVWQVRHGADFAAAGSIAFAILLAMFGGWIARAGRWPASVGAGVAVAFGALGMWPVLVHGYAPAASASLSALSAPADGDRGLATPSGSLQRFLQEVRRLTPEPAGYTTPTEPGCFACRTGIPDYGILSIANVGHALNYAGRRATPMNGYQHLLDAENYARAFAFYRVESEAEALAIARDLRTPYAISLHWNGFAPGSMAARLHGADGRGGAGLSRLQRFRLLTEGPPGGVPMTDLFGLPRRVGVVPYKLWQIVEGAQLEILTRPDQAVLAEIDLTTPTGRGFTYRAGARADANGTAHMTVPYSTEPTAPVRARGLYRLSSGAASARIAVPERDVIEGRLSRVTLAID